MRKTNRRKDKVETKRTTRKAIAVSQSSVNKGSRIYVDNMEEPEGTPLRPIFCLKRKTDMKRFEEREDCFILDFDPDDDSPSVLLSKDHLLNNVDAPDVSVIAVKGQVACRDYPHSRHLCAEFPFENTAHERHCKLCYCFVCDLAAPCRSWTTLGHCHAIDNEAWKSQRRLVRKPR